MGFSKTYARSLSRFVLVLLSGEIANAQSRVPVDIFRVPYGISIVASPVPNTDTHHHRRPNKNRLRLNRAALSEQFWIRRRLWPRVLWYM